MNQDGTDAIAELVRQARGGDREALARLAEAARPRLYAYALRATMRDDIAQDIAQETLVTMVTVLDHLEKPEHFWSWLFGIAYNRIRNQRRRENTRRAGQKELETMKQLSSQGDAGLESLMNQELKQAVLEAMRELKPRHRDVICMRCYENMPYAQIAQVMDASEFGARMLFHRAKRALRKRLSRQGVGRGAFLVALALFGKMTASAAGQSVAPVVTSASLEVGVAAGIAAAVLSVPGVITVLGVGAASVMVAAGPLQSNDSKGRSFEAPSVMPVQVEGRAGGQDALDRTTFYYPRGDDGAVMIRHIAKSRGSGFASHWMQNADHNYFFNARNNTLYLNNHRMWRGDLSVQQLPTDPPAFTEFLINVQQQPSEMTYVGGDSAGLLVVMGRNAHDEDYQAAFRYPDTLMAEECFQYNWPSDVRVVDQRDAMHRRGWTCFDVTGHIGGHAVTGGGRIPFVHAYYDAHRPWLVLETDTLAIKDNGSGAAVYDAEDGCVARYAGGAFFAGLSRPWQGLHSLDSVRRDAAEARCEFETRYDGSSGRAEVVVYCSGARAGRLVYTIDMATDVVTEIVAWQGEGGGAVCCGQLQFIYHQQLNPDHREEAPRVSSAGRRAERPGVGWLFSVIEEEWSTSVAPTTR